MKLPHMPDGLTPEWMTELLREEGLLSGSAAVKRVEREQVGDGTGMMSEVSRLRIICEGECGDLPETFVAKYPSQIETNREVAMSYKLYEREVRYFAELDPLTSAHSPRPYVTRLAGDSFLILMEDMGDYRVGDQTEGANLEDTECAIDELAKLHATFWNNVTGLDWVPGIADSYHAENMSTLVGIGWPNMCEIFADYLSPEIARRGDQFRTHLRDLQAEMHRAPITLLHGDFRLDNLLFGVKPEHKPVAIIDWQGPLLGKGMVDVALMLGQSTRSDIRSANERAMIERYVEALALHGVADYPFERAWGDYEWAMLYNWVYTGVVAGTLDVHNERAFAWMSQMVARHSRASIDLNVFRLLA